MDRDEALGMWAYRHEYARLRDKYERQKPMTRDERECLGALTTKLDEWLATAQTMRVLYRKQGECVEPPSLSPLQSRIIYVVRRLGQTTYHRVAEEMNISYAVAFSYTQTLIRRGYIRKIEGKNTLLTAVSREEAHA